MMMGLCWTIQSAINCSIHMSVIFVTIFPLMGGPVLTGQDDDVTNLVNVLNPVTEDCQT